MNVYVVRAIYGDGTSEVVGVYRNEKDAIARATHHDPEEYAVVDWDIDVMEVQ